VSQSTSTGDVVRTIHLDDDQVAKILDEMDTSAAKSPDERKMPRYRCRIKALTVHMQHPGSSTTVPYQVPTRNISERGISFLHGGFVHTGTRCLVQLITSYGTWDDVRGTVVSSQYVKANIHEVHVRFDGQVDPSVYSSAVVHSRVLLAEDDQATARLSTLHLEQLNAVVDHAENGQIAVDKAMKNAYDVILMDMVMPVMDGFEAVRELRNHGYTSTIVAVTALTRDDDNQRCLDAGCDKYIAKPFRRQQLGDLLQSLREEPLISSSCNDLAMADVINAYVEELPGKVRAIEEAMVKKDANGLATIVRTLKAEGTGHGFEIITETAAQIESMLINGTSFDDVQKDVTVLTKLCMQARSSANASR